MNVPTTRALQNFLHFCLWRSKNLIDNRRRFGTILDTHTQHWTKFFLI
jgi:hypothetical protein